MSVSTRSTVRPPSRASARSAARSPSSVRPRHPIQFRLKQRLLAFDLLSNVWRLAEVIRVYSDHWDERRSRVPPPPAQAPLKKRLKQIRLRYVGWFDSDDCDILMCDVPYRVREVTEEAAAECQVDLKAELDTNNDNACSNCLEGGAECGSLLPVCCESCTRIYHPDCLRFIDKETGSREEEEAREMVQRDGAWTCTWCSRKEVRPLMQAEHAKNRARRLESQGDTLMWWDQQREQEELKPPYGPERFFQFVKEEYEREKRAGRRSRKRRKTPGYKAGRKRRQQHRQQADQPQQQQRPAQEPELVEEESAEQQQELEEEAEEDGQQEDTAAADTTDARSADALIREATEEAMQLVRHAEQNSNGRRHPLSALRQPGASGGAKVRKRVRKTEEVDLSHEMNEMDGGVSDDGAEENEEGGCGSDVELADDYSLEADGELGYAAVLFGGDYTPMSSGSGMSDAESHSPTSPSLSSSFLPGHFFERNDDSDPDRDDRDNGGRRLTLSRSITPTRHRAGNGEQPELQDVKPTKQEPLRVAPSTVATQVPANFFLSPAPHAIKTEESTETSQQAATVSSSRLSATSSAATASVQHPSPRPEPDDVIIIDDSDDEQPVVEPLQHPAASTAVAQDPPTAPTLQSPFVSSTSPPTVSSSHPAPPTTFNGSAPSVLLLTVRPRPRIRPSASPSLLSFTSSTADPLSSSYSSSSSSSSSASFRPPSSSSASSRPLLPKFRTSAATASSSAVGSTAVSAPLLPVLSVPSSFPAPSTTASSSRPRSNRAASYSRQSIGQTGHMRSVRAGGTIQMQSAALQLCFSSNTAHGTGSLRVDGLDFTRPQQVRIGETVIDLPPLVIQQPDNTRETETNASSPQPLITTPPVHTVQQISPLPSIVPPDLPTDLAEAATDWPVQSSAVSASVVELKEEEMDDENNSSGQSTSLNASTDDTQSSVVQPSSPVAARQSCSNLSMCCLCSRQTTKQRHHPRPSSAQLAALGYTGEVPYPQRAWACEWCGYFLDVGKLPLCLMDGANSNNCAFCDKALKRYRRPMPARQLAKLGYTNPPPHPKNVHVCQTCEWYIYHDQIWRCDSIFRSLSTLPIDDEEYSAEAQAASAVALVAEYELHCSSSSSSTSRSALSSSSSPSVSAPPCERPADVSNLPAPLLPSSDPHSVATSAAPAEVHMDIETEMEEMKLQSATPVQASSADSATAVRASRPRRAYGGNQSEFLKQIEQLTTAETREKRPRKRPNWYARDLESEEKAEEDSDGSGQQKEKGSKKRKAADGWDAQQDELLLTLHDAGKSTVEIGAVLSRSRQAVAGRLYTIRPRNRVGMDTSSSQDAASTQQQSDEQQEEEAKEGQADCEEDIEDAGDEEEDDRTWNSQQDQQLLTLVGQGHSCKVIGVIMGNRSRQAVKSRLYRLRHQLTDKESQGEKEEKKQDRAQEHRAAGGRPREWTEAKDQQLMALVAKGRAHSRIAKKMHVSVQSVHNRVKRLKRRSRASSETGRVVVAPRDVAVQSAANHPGRGAPWLAKDDARLQQLVADSVPAGVIAERLGRSTRAIQGRLFVLRSNKGRKAAQSDTDENDEKEDDDEHSNSNDSSDEQDQQPPAKLNGETWRRLCGDGPLPWLLNANGYRAVREQLSSSSEEKEEKAERSPEDNRRLFSAAKPVYTIARAASTRLQEKCKVLFEKKRAEYGCTAAHNRHTTAYCISLVYEANCLRCLPHCSSCLHFAVCPLSVLDGTEYSGSTKSRRLCRWLRTTWRGRERWSCSTAG